MSPGKERFHKALAEGRLNYANPYALPWDTFKDLAVGYERVCRDAIEKHKYPPFPWQWLMLLADNRKGLPIDEHWIDKLESLP